MKVYIELLLLLFVGMTPTIISVVFLTNRSQLKEGTAALIILTVTCVCTTVAFALKFRNRRRDSSEEADQEDISTASVESSNGPPKYDQLYPDKIVISPASPDSTVSSGLPFEPTLYVNPYNDDFAHSSYTWQSGCGEEQDEDGLPSYSEAVILEKTAQP